MDELYNIFATKKLKAEVTIMSDIVKNLPVL